MCPQLCFLYLGFHGVDDHLSPASALPKSLVFHNSNADLLLVQLKGKNRMTFSQRPI